MYEENRQKKMVIAGILLAIGVIVPSIFHFANLTLEVFLPMHISVLLGGFLLPPFLALILGLITPLATYLLLGLPEIFPMGIILIMELATCGISTSIFYRKKKFPILVSLIPSIIRGKLVGAITVLVLGSIFKIELTPVAYLIDSVKIGLPGIIGQIIIVSTIIFVIEKYTTINFD